MHSDRLAVLRRNSVLDALTDLLNERDWSQITLADVANRVGISRQTIYNEFSSRTGLAQAYAIRIADVFVDHVEAAIEEHQGDVAAALKFAVTAFFLDAAGDPLIRSLYLSDRNTDLLKLITVGSQEILVRASQRLAAVFKNSWVEVSDETAERGARMAVRIAMSYIALPAEEGSEVANDFAELLAPYIQSAIAEK